MTSIDRRRAGAALVIAIVAALAMGAPSLAGGAAVEADAGAPLPPGAPPPQGGLSLGAFLATSSPGWSAVLPTPGATGALVLAVIPGSPASKAQISPGEVIVAIDGVLVQNAERAGTLLAGALATDHVLSLAGPDGTARAVPVVLAPAVASFSASAYLTQAMSEDPGEVVRFLAGQSLPDPRPALRIASQLAADRPDFASAHALAARRLLDAVRAGRGSSAPSAEEQAALLDAIARSLELDPVSAENRSVAGQVFLDLGDPAQAEAAAAEAVRLDPVSANGRHLLGLARLRAGRAAEGLPELRRAVELDPYAPQYYESLAEGYEAVGQASFAAKTTESLKALRSRRPQPQRRSVLPVLAVTAVICAAVVGAFALASRRAGALLPSTPSADQSPRRRPTSLVGLLEGLTAVGAWSVLVPWAARGLGVAPDWRLTLEVADHVVPGAVIVAFGLAAVASSLKGPTGARPTPTVTPFVAAGLWMTLTHLSLVLEAFTGRQPWTLAVFHASPGPMAMGLALAVYLRAGRSPALPPPPVESLVEEAYATEP